MINALEHQKVNIAIITETMKKPKGARDVGDWGMRRCSGAEKVERAQAGVAVYVDKNWKHKIISLFAT